MNTVAAAVFLIFLHLQSSEVATQAAVYPGCPCNYELLWPSSCKCIDSDSNDETPVCPTNYNFKEETCECACNRFVVCPTNHHWDSEQCGCFCDASVNCPEHYEWDPFKCECVCNRLCPVAKTLNTNSCTCHCSDACGDCELQNPSTCECQTFLELSLAAVEETKSFQPVHAKKPYKYQYRRPN